MSTPYEVRLRRTGRWWAVDIPALSVQTQCRTLDEARDIARDTLARASGTPPESVDVRLVLPEAAPLLDGVVEARRRRVAAVDAEERALADAARALMEDLGVNQADTGRLLGLSPEDVSRLCPEPPRAPRPAPLAPLAPPAAPVRPPRGLAGLQRLRGGLPTGPQDNGTPARPRRQRPVRRPSWAITDDGA